MPDLKIELNCDFLRKIRENSNFATKILNIRISPGFLLIQKEMVIPTCFVSFSIIVCRIFFFKMANLCFKTEKVVKEIT